VNATLGTPQTSPQTRLHALVATLEVENAASCHFHCIRQATAARYCLRCMSRLAMTHQGGSRRDFGSVFSRAGVVVPDALETRR
jgi:hypothetical protein